MVLICKYTEVGRDPVKSWEEFTGLSVVTFKNLS